MTATFDETLAYLDKSYLTLDELALESGIGAARIEELIAAGCLPPHSHEAVLSLSVTTNIIGTIEAASRHVRYFHRSLIDLTKEAEELACARGVAAAAAEIRFRFEEEVARASGLAAGSRPHLDLAARAWVAWRDGTFGVCLKEIAPANMVRKVIATEAIKAFLVKAEDRPLTGEDKIALDAALANYVEVTGPFGPHEIEQSTRRRVYEPALRLAERLRCVDFTTAD